MRPAVKAGPVKVQPLPCIEPITEGFLTAISQMR